MAVTSGANPYPDFVERETTPSEHGAPARQVAGGGLVLASASPRRIGLLREAGFDPEVEPADVDDASIGLGPVPATDVAPALAHFKARRVAHRRRARGARSAWILAADTICERDGAVLGKPAGREEAARMIRSLDRRRHAVVTGWCLVSPAGQRWIGRDLAWIELGGIPEPELERFLDEELWRGKAGGYNLPEVVARGWPVRCEGDPQTVIGLPARRLAPLLASALRGALEGAGPDLTEGARGAQGRGA